MSAAARTHRVPGWQWAVYAVVTLVPVVVALAAIPRMPARIVTHWGADGRPDGWGSPWNALMMPGIGIGVSALMAWLTVWLADDDKAGGTRRSLFRSAFITVLAWSLMVVAHLAQLTGRWPRLLRGVDLPTMLCACLGVIVAAIGNACPAAPPNALFGIRVPAAMGDAWVWHKTQLVGGRLLVAAGVLIVVAAFLLPDSASILFSGILVLAAAAIAWIYSERISLRPHQVRWP